MKTSHNSQLLLVILLILVFLAGCADTPSNPGHQCTVQGSETVQVYKEADSTSKIVDTLQPGEIVIAQGKSGDYRVVTTPRLIDGYMLDRLCK